MRIVEVTVSARKDLSRAERMIESLCAREGLSATLKAPLSAYPRSVHWHFKHGRERGTLEVTLWRQRGRIWFSTHRGRAAPWIPRSLRRLRGALENRLR